MKDKVLDWCRRERIFAPGETVVCAVSGGADSVAMLHCLMQLEKVLSVRVSAAHFNHCLRGEASDGDEAFVRRLCASWGVPLAVERGDCAARAAQTGESVEEAARKLRYEFLLRQPGVIATAHHADDQLETVLINLLRGTGLKGLCAMAPRSGRVARPLLCLDRAQIEAYLAENGLPHREDATNAEDDALRNRLRHRVTPLLKEENPGLAGTVTRMTALLRQDEAFLQAQTQELLDRARCPGGYDCRVLRQAPEVLRSRAVRSLLQIPKPARSHVEAVLALLERDEGSARAELPGGYAMVRAYDCLRLCPPEEPKTFSPVTLLPGQSAVLDGAELTVSVEGPAILEKTVDFQSTFALKYDMMGETPAITVRPRKTGDSLRLPGGEKTVKKLLIDRKIPRWRRDLLPVIEAAQEIYAVYGLGADVRRAACPGDRALIVKIQLEGEKRT